MKLSILILASIVTTSLAQAQSYSRPGARQFATACECTQIRTLTGQDDVVGGEKDGSQSVCKFSAFGFNGQVSFEGGWLLTGDIVGFDCRGGVAGTRTVHYSTQPSPLCRITDVREVVATAGSCVHQGDTDYNNVFSAAERAAWAVKNAPITSGPAGYVGHASQMAIDQWNTTFAHLLSGSNLCDKSYEITEPRKYTACLALPVECRRLLFMNEVNPISARQIKDAYSEYSNNLNHCELP